MAPSSRVVIVPQGEFHFDVRYFENEKDTRYRSWCLPPFRRSLAGEEIPGNPGCPVDLRCKG